MRRRGVETWDLILTPTPEMTRHYREQYGYTGPVAEHGYPRDDALSAPDADQHRTQARQLLGIRDDQTAVLYAPTWRDDLATRPRRAGMADHLDIPRVAEALGDSHVLLLRGHRFHTPPAHHPAPGAARVIDVTDHPEINDLILASDVAVLDYSSLRFDVAITGKPMVFLVPDLDDYAGGVRGFLFPFTESAPGPLVRESDEVVEQVRDVAALAERWSAELAAFNATYNPGQDGQAAARVAEQILELLGPTT
jgi:CDP-glycerol glycerophosphotransferase (TagB/SpsB family)